MPGPSITGAIALAVGIGIQSSPEGAAASVPRRREGLGCFRSFWYGRLSAVVEPIAAALGAASLVLARPILPYALGFAAGAMIYVVVEELVPETQRDQNAHIATLGTLLGFAVMMGLEVALG